MTTPAVPPPAADQVDANGQETFAPPPPAAASGSERFFLWVGGLGIPRSDGWVGGVCAGIAARLRIDPLIVRGVLVIAALFGLPVIFLYAVAWALLPDIDGRIHTRDLFHRTYQPVQLGILATAIIGLVPTAPLSGRLFGLGYQNWSALSVFSWVVGLVLVAALLILIVRAARRTPGTAASDLPMASADHATPGASVLLGDSGITEETDAFPSVHDRPAPPSPLPEGVHDPADIAAWRAQHAAWKAQDQAWRREQQDAERVAREQLRRERQAAAAVFAAEASERRRIRRASNPRAGFAFTASVIGLALVTGSAVSLGSGLGPTSGALGALAGALVLGLGMIVAGALRRRSGFLAFATVVTLMGGLISGGFSAAPQVHFGYASIRNDEPTQIVHPFDQLNINLTPHDGAPRPIVVQKGSGTTYIDVSPGVELDLRASIGDVAVRWMRVEAESGQIIDHGIWEPHPRQPSVVTETFSAERGSVTTAQPVTLDQRSGDIIVTIHEPQEDTP